MTAWAAVDEPWDTDLDIVSASTGYGIEYHVNMAHVVPDHCPKDIGYKNTPSGIAEVHLVSDLSSWVVDSPYLKKTASVFPTTAVGDYV